MNNDKCPVCGTAHVISDTYCPNCNWEFRIMPDVVPDSVVEMENVRFRKFCEQFEHNKELFDRCAKQEVIISEQESEITKLNSKLAALSENIEKAKISIQEAGKEMSNSKADNAKLSSELTLAKDRLKELDKVKADLQSSTARYEGLLAAAQKEAADSAKKYEDMLAVIKPKIEKYQETIQYWKDKYLNSTK